MELQGILYELQGFYGEEKPSSDQSNSTICDKYDLMKGNFKDKK